MENTFGDARKFARGEFSAPLILAASAALGFALFSLSPEPRMLPLAFLGAARCWRCCYIRNWRWRCTW